MPQAVEKEPAFLPVSGPHRAILWPGLDASASPAASVASQGLMANCLEQVADGSLVPEVAGAILRAVPQDISYFCACDFHDPASPRRDAAWSGVRV